MAEGRYVGRRANLIGQAKVEEHGNKIEIAYGARVPTKDSKTHDLNFKETFVFTQSATANYRLRVSLLSIPIVRMSGLVAPEQPDSRDRPFGRLASQGVRGSAFGCSKTARPTRPHLVVASYSGLLAYRELDCAVIAPSCVSK